MRPISGLCLPKQSTGGQAGVAINNWWTGDGDERFWIEITNRDDIGENLIAPQLNDADREEWSYTTVNWVRPGDVVLHWSKLGEHSIVGYSHVSANPFESSLEWQSRGTYGRTHAPTGQEDAWEAPLSGYRELATPITQTRLRALEPGLRKVRDDLQALHEGSIYFPFAFSDKRPVRAAQAYLTKFPAALVATIPELDEVRQLAVDSPEVGTSAPTTLKPGGKSSSGYGRQNDSLRRKAVEEYSVSLVEDHLSSLGFSVSNVGTTKPWDITAIRAKLELELHVEVKGSTTARSAIDITEGEVRHAEDHQRTLLVVIDQIDMNDDLKCSGGRWRYWTDWVPVRDELIPTAYRHPLTAAEHVGRPSL
jgi:Domain of unknown function (DUF3883)